jgi:cytoskeletal protein RodZ
LQTIGILLQSLRLKHNLTVEQVSQETNIATHLLAYLEEDNFEKLPCSTFTKGFITSYAKVVDLSAAKALAIFRRDFTITESGKIMPRGLAKPLDKPTIVTSKILVVGCIIFLMCIFTGYLLVQLRNYQANPTIEVIRPKANTMVKGPIIPLKGFVSADSSVYVNGQLCQVFPTGEFQATIQLPVGQQIIAVKAVSNQNKITVTEIPVTVIDK